MNRQRVVFAILVMLLFSLACLSLSQPALKPPAGSPSNQVPLYPNAQRIAVNESDLVTVISDMLGPEYLLYSSSTDISWTKDTGTKVQGQLDELLPDSSWRLESDWYSYGQFYISTWRYGDLRVLIACFDNLDSEQISNIERRYGISGPEPGSTLVIIHLWDTSKPLPTATPTRTPIPSPTPTSPPTVTAGGLSAIFLGQDGKSYAGRQCEVGTTNDNVHIRLSGLRTDVQPVGYRIEDRAPNSVWGVWATPCNPVSNWLLFVESSSPNQADLYFKPFRDAPAGTEYTIIIQYSDGTTQVTTVIGSRVRP